MISRNKQLCFALEKAHFDTVGFGYEQRVREQDAYLKAAFATSKNNPDILLALLYSLSCMHDDTYAALMKNSTFASRLELMNELIAQVPDLNASSTIKASVIELTTFEIHRVAAEHATSATTMDAGAHEAKNFRFIIELDALLNDRRLKQYFSQDVAQDSLPQDKNSDCTQARNSSEGGTETDSTSDFVFRRAVNLAEYWENFLTNLKTSTVTPAALMTTTLIKFSQSSKNIKPLLDWQEALEKYRQDPYGFLPEASKTPAQVEFKKIQAWCDDKEIVSGSHDLTGSGVAMYAASPKTNNGDVNALFVQSVT